MWTRFLRAILWTTLNMLMTARALCVLGPQIKNVLMLRVLSLNCAHAPHEVNVNDLCLSSSATLSSPTVPECPDQPSPTPTEVPPTQPSPDTVLFNIQSQSDSLLRVPTRIVYGSRTSRPLSALVDIGFTGHVLVSTKIATKLGGASPAPS